MFRDAIFTALGEASICWNPVPTGVFDSQAAKAAGEKLIAKIGDHTPRRVAKIGETYFVQESNDDGTWAVVGKEYQHETSAYAALGRLAAVERPK